MYSRNRTAAAEVRYADNVPPVYGGSRFYRGVPQENPTKRREEDVRPADPDGGIPAHREARTVFPASVTDCAEEPMPECPKAGEDPVCAAEEEAVSRPTASDADARECGGRREGFLPALLGDSEEILLIVLLLLLTGEKERSSDVIFILLLLMIVR